MKGKSGIVTATEMGRKWSGTSANCIIASLAVQLDSK